MRTFHAGDAIMITVPLTRDGEPFVGDAGMTWSLRDQDGLLMPAYTDQPIISTDSSVKITIPALANTISAPSVFEQRSLIIKGEVGGVPFQIIRVYRITPWLNIGVIEDDIRGFIGIDAGELPDQDIDIVAAYLKLASIYAGLPAALVSGTQDQQRANAAIKGQTVLDLLPSLPARVSKKADDGSAKVERFTIDFNQLALDAGRLVQDVIVVTDDLSGPVLAVLSGPAVDPVTGT